MPIFLALQVKMQKSKGKSQKFKTEGKLFLILLPFEI